MLLFIIYPQLLPRVLGKVQQNIATEGRCVEQPVSIASLSGLGSSWVCYELCQYKILAYPDVHVCVREGGCVARTGLLPVSMWFRLLPLRLSSFSSLDSRNCFGLRCFMLLLDRSIFTMSDGRSDGMLFKPAEGERCRRIRPSAFTIPRLKGQTWKTKCIYNHACWQRPEAANISGTLTEMEMCLHLYAFEMGCRLCAAFSRWRHWALQHFTCLPEGAFFRLHWKPHALIFVYEDVNAWNIFRSL